MKIKILVALITSIICLLLSGCGEALAFTYTINADKYSETTERELSQALSALAKAEGLRLTINNDDAVVFVGDRTKPVTAAFAKYSHWVHLIEGPADRGESSFAKNIRLKIEDILKRVFGSYGFSSREEQVTKSPLA